MVASTGSSPAPVDELLRVVPRFVDRTSRQVEISRVLLGHLPCIGEQMISLGLAKRGAAYDTTGARADGGGGAGTSSAPVATTADPDPSATEGRVSDGSQSSAGRSGSLPDEEELAIPEYDSLAASQVIPRLEMLQASDLRRILRYEENKRNRQTIVHKVGQLLAGTAGQ